MNITDCPCGSAGTYNACCGPYHQKLKTAPTAEALMRSRYSAFVVADADYLYETTAPEKRRFHSRKDYLNSAKNTRWVRLEILDTGWDMVEFKAFYLNLNFQTEVLHERSRFKQKNGKWYYVDGQFYSS